MLFMITISRYLPTESAARFFLLLNISTIAAVCFRWGLDEVIVRRVAQLPQNEVVAVGRHLNALSHRRVTILASACLIATLAGFHTAFQSVFGSIGLPNLIISLCAAAFVAMTACAARILQGRGRNNYATFLLNIAVPGLSLIGLFLLVAVKEPNAKDLIALYASVAVVVYLVTTFSLYGNPLLLFVSGFNIQWRNGDSSAANKLGTVVLAQQAVGWIALLIVPYAYGDDAYKGFVVLQKVATLISLTMLAVNFTFSRHFATMYAEGKLKELRQMAVHSLLAIIVGSFFIIALFIFIRKWLFDYAQIGADKTALMVVLLVSQVFFSISALFSVILSMAHDDSYLFVTHSLISVAGAVVLVIACQFLPLEVASALLVASYFALSVALGLRVRHLTGSAREIKI